MVTPLKWVNRFQYGYMSSSNHCLASASPVTINLSFSPIKSINLFLNTLEMADLHVNPLYDHRPVVVSTPEHRGPGYSPLSSPLAHIPGLYDTQIRGLLSCASLLPTERALCVRDVS